MSSLINPKLQQYAGMSLPGLQITSSSVVVAKSYANWPGENWNSTTIVQTKQLQEGERPDCSKMSKMQLPDVRNEVAVKNYRFHPVATNGGDRYAARTAELPRQCGLHGPASARDNAGGHSQLSGEDVQEQDSVWVQCSV